MAYASAVHTGEGILGDVIATVRERRRGPAPVRRFVAGERLIAVSIGGDRPGTGVAHRPPGSLPDTGAIHGSSAFDLAAWSRTPGDTGGDPAPTRAVGMAALNALSAPFVDWRRGDPMATLADDIDTIATVGLFRPAFRKWSDVEVRVVEREPVESVDAPASVSVSTFDPDDAGVAFDGVDVLFVTGSALVYGGLEAYLRAAKAVPTVVLVGATASFLPGPAFDAGVAMLAGARVTAPDHVLVGIADGQCGTDLHDSGLEKVYVVADDPAGLDLPGRPA